MLSIGEALVLSIGEALVLSMCEAFMLSDKKPHSFYWNEVIKKFSSPSKEFENLKRDILTPPHLKLNLPVFNSGLFRKNILPVV